MVFERVFEIPWIGEILRENLPIYSMRLERKIANMSKEEAFEISPMYIGFSSSIGPFYSKRAAKKEVAEYVEGMIQNGGVPYVDKENHFGMEENGVVLDYYVKLMKTKKLRLGRGTLPVVTCSEV